MALLQIFSSRGELSLLKKVDPLLSDVTPENGNISHNKGSKPRRSIREREHNVGISMDGIQSRHKKVGSFHQVLYVEVSWKCYKIIHCIHDDDWIAEVIAVNVIS